MVKLNMFWYFIYRF